MLICIYVYLYICKYLCTYICIYVYICKYLCTYIYIYMFLNKYVNTYVYVWLFVYIYIHTYEDMYVCMYVCMHAWMDGWMDGWMDVYMQRSYTYVIVESSLAWQIEVEKYTSELYKQIATIPIMANLALQKSNYVSKSASFPIHRSKMLADLPTSQGLSRYHSQLAKSQGSWINMKTVLVACCRPLFLNTKLVKFYARKQGNIQRKLPSRRTMVMVSIQAIMSTTSSCQPPIITQLESERAQERVNSRVKALLGQTRYFSDNVPPGGRPCTVFVPRFRASI